MVLRAPGCLRAMTQWAQAYLQPMTLWAPGYLQYQQLMVLWALEYPQPMTQGARGWLHPMALWAPEYLGEQNRFSGNSGKAVFGFGRMQAIDWRFFFIRRTQSLELKNKSNCTGFWRGLGSTEGWYLRGFSAIVGAKETRMRRSHH